MNILSIIGSSILILSVVSLLFNYVSIKSEQK